MKIILLMSMLFSSTLFAASLMECKINIDGEVSWVPGYSKGVIPQATTIEKLTQVLQAQNSSEAKVELVKELLTFEAHAKPVRVQEKNYCDLSDDVGYATPEKCFKALSSREVAESVVELYPENQDNIGCLVAGSFLIISSFLTTHP